ESQDGEAPESHDEVLDPHAETPEVQIFQSEPKPERRGDKKSWNGFVPSDITFGFLPPPRAPSELQVHFFDIGQGDNTFVSCPNGNVIVVDGGSVKGGKAKAEAAEAYLNGLVGE